MPYWAVVRAVPHHDRLAHEGVRGVLRLVIRIAITVEAFDAICATLPLGNVCFENKTDEEGNRLIWLDRAVVDKLRSLRGPGESYSDAILRLAKETDNA